MTKLFNIVNAVRVKCKIDQSTFCNFRPDLDLRVDSPGNIDLPGKLSSWKSLLPGKVDFPEKLTFRKNRIPGKS